MGITAVLLLSQGRLEGGFHVPFWVVLSCQAAMALGTMAGGWRIVRTTGSRITHLTPMQGFCDETDGAIALFGATWLGVARGIVVAWVITLPAAAAVGAACYALAATFVRN